MNEAYRRHAAVSNKERNAEIALFQQSPGVARAYPNTVLGSGARPFLNRIQLPSMIDDSCHCQNGTPARRSA